eukprot:SAG11_NODE_787_length_7169_cov_4.571146_2_plen_179_part_00
MWYRKIWYRTGTRLLGAGHLEVCFPGHWKTLREAQLAFLPARSVPPPADPRHPCALMLGEIRRAFQVGTTSIRRIDFVPSGCGAAPRITANVRRLLAPDIILQPGNRRLGAKSMRKTMASAPAAQGVLDTTIQHWGLWGRSSLTHVMHYIDRAYPPDPFVASVYDFLLPVSRAPFLAA